MAHVGYLAPPPSEADDLRVDGRELLRILRRRGRWILATTIVFVLAALAYLSLTRPLYTAAAELLVDPRDRQVVTNDVTPSAMSPDGGMAQVESQLKVLASDNVLKRVIASQDLATDPEFGAAPADGPGSFLSGAAGLASPNGGPREEPAARALRLLKRAITVKRAEKAFVIDVAATTGERETSARLANGIVAAYLDDQAQARADASRRASASLTARLDDLRRRVEEAENRVQAYKADNNLIEAGGRLVGEQQLSELNNQLIAARARTAEARSRAQQLEALQRSGTENASTSEAISSATITQLRAQYSDIVRQQSDLKTQLGARHPALAAVESQLANVRRLIAVELGRIAASARNDYERALVNEESLAKSLAGLKTESVVTGRAQVRLRELEREAEANRAVYATFLTRARETGEQETIDTTNVRVISPASPPFARSWPPRLLILLGAGLLGLGCGTALALLRDYADTTIGSGERLWATTGHPVLAVVPRLVARSIAEPASLAGPEGPRRLSGPAASGRRAQASAAIGNLLRELKRSGREAGRPRVLMVAASGREDTASVVLRLVEVAASGGERVMLIDADPKGRLTSMLGLEPDHGLADVLGGKVALDEALVALPRGDGRLLAGPFAAADTGTSQDVQARILDAASSFDLVVIDAGPVSDADTTRLIAPLVDDIVFVAEAGITRESDVAAAFDALRRAGATVRGTILVDDGPGRA